jgi:site-specific recombinase XerD
MAPILTTYCDALASRGGSAKTAREVTTAWRQLAAWWGATTGQPWTPAAVSALDLADYRRFLSRRLKPASANTRLRQIKAVCRWAAETGALSTDPARTLRLLPDSPPPVRSLSRRELAALLRAAHALVRDVTIITVLARTGLRVSGLTALTWDAVVIRERSGHLEVRQGKGGRRRVIPLTLMARQALVRWHDHQEPVSPIARVFPVTPRAVQKALARVSRQAGLERTVTPHMLRHTFAKALVDAGVPLDRVAALAGHASLTTTARYTRPTHEDLEAAVARVEWV